MKALRLSRNQSRQKHFTTKVTKSTKLKNFEISMSETFVNFVPSWWRLFSPFSAGNLEKLI